MIISSSAQLEFIGFNHVPECPAWVDKEFSYYVIQYAESGELDLQEGNGKIHRLSGPVAWMTFPGPHFRFGRRDGGSWNHRFASFHGPLADNYAKQGIYPGPRNPIVKIVETGRFTETFDKLLERLNRHGTSPDYRTVHILEDIMLQLNEQPRAGIPHTPSRAKIINLMNRIELHPERKLDLKQAAHKLGVSYPHFRKLFREISGMPPAQYALDKRLVKATAMLRDPELSISEIAGELGFYDVFHFSKIFKKKHGISPGKYRKNQFPS